MSATTAKLLGVLAGVVVAGVLIGLYVGVYLVGNTNAVAASTIGTTASLTLQTVPTVGPTEAPNHPDWVSYLVKTPSGQWKRTTVFDLPAHATVHVTIYNFDGASGLRNPLFSRVQGVDGGVMTLDGKTVDSIPPADASHTFAVPEMGIVVPLAPVPDNAKNPCGASPCPLSNDHRTITFTFHTGAPGHYRWQCFVPCAAGFMYGFGGPMQTIGYMDGFLNVH